MALMNCPECGKQVSDTAPSCIHCGYQPLQRAQPPAPTSIINWRKSIRIWSLLIIAVVVILAWGKACNYMTNESAQAEADTIATNPKQLTEGELESISQNIEGGKSVIELGDFASKQIATVQDKYKYEFRSVESYQYKDVIYIRLREPLGEPELKEIAQQIRKDYPSNKRLLIFYLLAGTDIADGAWASSHFTPNLEIKILKTTKEIEADRPNNRNSPPDGNFNTSTKKWYDGGNLHKAKISTWKKATYKNKLATCGDFMAKTDNTVTMEEVKRRSIELVTCIDAAVKDMPSMDDWDVTEVATICIVGMGYKKL